MKTNRLTEQTDSLKTQLNTKEKEIMDLIGKYEQLKMQASEEMDAKSQYAREKS